MSDEGLILSAPAPANADDDGANEDMGEHDYENMDGEGGADQIMTPLEEDTLADVAPASGTGSNTSLVPVTNAKAKKDWSMLGNLKKRLGQSSKSTTFTAEQREDMKKQRKEAETQRKRDEKQRKEAATQIKRDEKQRKSDASLAKKKEKKTRKDEVKEAKKRKKEEAQKKKLMNKLDKSVEQRDSQEMKMGSEEGKVQTNVDDEGGENTSDAETSSQLVEGEDRVEGVSNNDVGGNGKGDNVVGNKGTEKSPIAQNVKLELGGKTKLEDCTAPINYTDNNGNLSMTFCPDHAKTTAQQNMPVKHELITTLLQLAHQLATHSDPGKAQDPAASSTASSIASSIASSTAIPPPLTEPAAAAQVHRGTGSDPAPPPAAAAAAQEAAALTNEGKLIVNIMKASLIESPSEVFPKLFLKIINSGTKKNAN